MGGDSVSGYCEGMNRIFFDKNVWRETGKNWVSFESDPRLRVTKQNIYGRCVPCITHLYRQLQEGRREIELREAFHCWKVVAVLENKEQCFDVLREYEKSYLGARHVKGKLGSSQPSKATMVLIFHMEDEKERDKIFQELVFCARKVNPQSIVFYQRACSNLYYDLLGDWRDWKEPAEVKNPQIRPVLLQRIRKLLYWEKGG